MKKILLCVFTVLLAVNIFAEDTEPTPTQKQKFYDWSIAQFNREQIHITPAYSNAVYQALLPGWQKPSNSLNCLCLSRLPRNR